MLQTEAQHSVELQHFDDIVERETSRVYTQVLDVSKLDTALRSGEVYHPPSNRTWILGIAIALAGLGTLWLIWFKSTNKYCPCILRPKRTRTTSDHKVNECSVGFQMTLQRSEENSEVTPEEAPEKQ